MHRKNWVIGFVAGIVLHGWTQGQAVAASILPLNPMLAQKPTLGENDAGSLLNFVIALAVILLCAVPLFINPKRTHQN